MLLLPQDRSCFQRDQRRHHGDPNTWQVRKVCQTAQILWMPNKPSCKVRFFVFWGHKEKRFYGWRSCNRCLLTAVRYKLLHVLEFDANRRRMSVILQTPSGKLHYPFKTFQNCPFMGILTCFLRLYFILLQIQKEIKCFSPRAPSQRSYLSPPVGRSRKPDCTWTSLPW